MDIPFDIIKHHILPNCNILYDLIQWRVVSKQFKKMIDDILNKEEPLLSVRYLKIDYDYTYGLVYNAEQFNDNFGLILFDIIKNYNFNLEQFNLLINYFLYSKKLIQVMLIGCNKMCINIYHDIIYFKVNNIVIYTEHSINLKNNISQKFHLFKLFVEIKQIQEKFGKFY
jgi:hypothetical protein